MLKHLLPLQIKRMILWHLQHCISHWYLPLPSQVLPHNMEAHSPLKVPDSQRRGVSTAGCPRHKWAVQKQNKQKHLLLLVFWRKSVSKTENMGCKAGFKALNSGSRLFQYIPPHFTRAGRKVFACVDGKPKTGTAVNCSDVFKILLYSGHFIHCQCCQLQEHPMENSPLIFNSCHGTYNFTAQPWIGCSVTGLTNHRMEVSHPTCSK